MLALIVGSDDLPAALLAELDEKPLICALDGHAPDGIAVDILFRLERLGTLLADLGARGVREVCLAGAIVRPKIDPQKIDTATIPLIPVLQKAMMKGDDGALRGVIAIFEEAGFAIRPAHAIAPRLLPPQGCPTIRQFDQRAEADALRGQTLVAAMSRVDVGQCCVVHDGQALAIEALFGTDWLLASLRDRPDGSGGILFKAPKTQQDRRVDLPAIGPDTVLGAARAGLDGIVIQAKGVLVLHRAQVIAECDRLGLFLWVRAG